MKEREDQAKPHFSLGVDFGGIIVPYSAENSASGEAFLRRGVGDIDD